MVTRINFQQLREDRQGFNNLMVVNSVLNNDLKKFYKNINKKEYNRALKELGITHVDFWKKCKYDLLFLKMSAGRLAKKASRQGTKDEKIQIETCNNLAQEYEINIRILGKSDFRPKKDGKIISNAKMTKDKIRKDQCLKSFDAKITGTITGWLSAKITFGSGGHQDNVFEEQDTLCMWWENYMKDKKERLVILIDTDREKEFTTLKNKYKECKNILITDHVGLQEFIMKVDDYKS